MTVFNAESTTDDVLAGVDLSGKRILVTGASAGLGLETARALVAHGADVVGATLDLALDEGASASIREAAAIGGGSLKLIQFDLASLASVRAAADALVAEAIPFDIVIANAGVMVPSLGKTADGFETHFGINYLGHFAFVNRIASLIKPGGRLVTLSSVGHRSAEVDIADPGFETSPYNPWVAYGRSKTANILFAVEFDRRHKDRGIRAAAVHPGVIDTGLTVHLGQDALAAMITDANARAAAAGEPAFAFKSVPQGAATSVWAAVVADGDAVGGRYAEDCHVAEIIDGEGIYGVRSYALDADNASALWAKSEELIGESF